MPSLFTVTPDVTTNNGTQTIENLVVGGSSIYESHNGFVVPITIPGGGNLSDITYKMYDGPSVVDTGSMTTNHQYSPEITLNLNAAQTSSQSDNLTSLYSSVKTAVGAAPRAIYVPQLISQSLFNDGSHHPAIMLPGTFSKFELSYPVSWTSFIVDTTTFRRWFKKRWCWTSSGGYYEWVLTTGSYAVCPAAF